MDKKTLLGFCRYYKGEDSLPKNIEGNQDDAAFWYIEKCWLELTLKKNEFLGDLLDEYLFAGLREFSNTDDTPVTLKALLFNRWGHWFGGYGMDVDASNFKKFYSSKYSKNRLN